MAKEALALLLRYWEFAFLVRFGIVRQCSLQWWLAAVGEKSHLVGHQGNSLDGRKGLFRSFLLGACFAFMVSVRRILVELEVVLVVLDAHV